MRRLALIAAAALAVALAGCGGGETVAPEPETTEGENPAATQTQPAVEGDPENGKKIFASAGCGSCHTLEDAGSSGTIGPNLDEAKPDLELAVDRVTNGSGAMPPFKDELSEKEIADVSAYVVEASGGG
jgi:mono/diheme cytochrome c family protein